MILQMSISEKTPNLCHLAPAGPTYIEDLNEAGGVYAVMAELNKKGLLHTDCMTVTGKTVGENIAGAVNKNPEVIRPIDNPYSQTGGLAVLKGNLAPDGSVVKRSAVVDEMLVHEGPARVFDCEEDAIEAIKGGKINAGDVVVIRYEGPKGGPGMTRDAESDFRHCRYGTGIQCGADHGRTVQRSFQRSIHRSCITGSSSRRPDRPGGRRRYHQDRYSRSLSWNWMCQTKSWQRRREKWQPRAAEGDHRLSGKIRMLW